MRLGFRDLVPFLITVILPTVFLALVPIARPALIFDELTYSVQSRINPDSLETEGFLYSHIVNLAMTCGIEAYFDCGRFLSIPFLSLQTTVIYLFAVQVLNRPLALMVAIGSITFTSSIWVYMFTPESMHIALSIVGFLVFGIGYMKARETLLPAIVLSAVVFGFASNVKVHTVLVLPALFLIVYLASKRISGSSTTGTIHGLVFGATMLLSKVILGFVLAGAKGVDLLGGYQVTLENYFSGRIVAPNDADASSVYFGIDSMPFSGVTYGLSDIPILFAGQLWVMLPITVIAFAGVFLVSTLRIDSSQETADHSRLRDLLLWSLILVANLVLLATSFAAFVTVLGDNHVTRPLFRYVEYALVISLILAITYVLSSPNFTKDGRAARYYLIALALVAIAFGGQSTIEASYSDSSFIPVLGRPQFWLPLLAASILLGLAMPNMSSKALRTGLVALWGLPYVAAGLVTHWEYLQGSDESSNLGSTTGQYLTSWSTEDRAATMFLGRGVLGLGTAMAEAQFDERNYRVVLGSNPANLDLLDAEYRHVVAVDNVFIKASPNWRLQASLGEAEIFTRDLGVGESLKDVAQKRIGANFHFDYYSNGAFFTNTGELSLEFDRDFRIGDEVELCIVTLPEMQKTSGLLLFGSQSLNLELEGSAETCLQFGVVTEELASKIVIESPPAIYELESGQIVGQVGWGISKARVVN